MKVGASRVPAVRTRESSVKPSSLVGGWKRLAAVKMATGKRAPSFEPPLRANDSRLCVSL